MAMRIVTIDKLNEYINDKTKREHVIVRKNDSIRFVPKRGIPFLKRPACVLQSTMVSDFNEEVPFLKFRDQVSGVLKVNGSVVDDDEIKAYAFYLD